MKRGIVTTDVKNTKRIIGIVQPCTHKYNYIEETNSLKETALIINI